MDARLIQFHITPKPEGQTQEELRQNPSGFNMEFIAKEKYISEAPLGFAPLVWG